MNFDLLPRYLKAEARVMTFVDGENLAIRFGSLLKEAQRAAPNTVVHESNVFVWSRFASLKGPHDHVRHYYYTSISGDEPRRLKAEQSLKDVGIEAPRVFHKDRDKGSKRVDIVLATEMLTHAHRGNYDVAVLVAGDEDYIPLVDEVKAEGCRVILWFVRNGLSPQLLHTADHFYDLADLFFSSQDERVTLGNRYYY